MKVGGVFGFPNATYTQCLIILSKKLKISIEFFNFKIY